MTTTPIYIISTNYAIFNTQSKQQDKNIVSVHLYFYHGILDS